MLIQIKYKIDTNTAYQYCDYPDLNNQNTNISTIQNHITIGYTKINTST